VIVLTVIVLTVRNRSHSAHYSNYLQTGKKAEMISLNPSSKEQVEKAFQMLIWRDLKSGVAYCLMIVVSAVEKSLAGSLLVGKGKGC